MLPDALRVATPADNDALRELELACPQGTRLKICSERDDYFVRSRLYGNDHTLVAVDRAKDRLFGVIAASTKEVRIAGVPRKVVVFNDLRVHPDYRRSVLARHMLGAWLAMERWAKEQAADAICGLVKSDNDAMSALQGKKSEYRWVGRMVVLNRPVFRRARPGAAPEIVPAGDDGLADALWKEYGGRDFVPEALRARCPTPAMEATGLFETWRLARGDSWASLGVYRVSKTMRTRVVTIPWYYRVAGPAFSAISPVVPLPRIPRPGGTIAYTFAYNHLAEGPLGLVLWKELLARANDLALADGADLLTAAFDPADRFLAPFARGSLNRIDYRLGMRWLAGGEPPTVGGCFVDPRDMS
jgi:GNAT superfamily N-acetyltransferase